MEPIFIYYNNLNFEQDKNFLLEFSDSDKLDDVIFKNNKDYYITNISCYIDLTVDVTKLPQFDKIKEISDLSNAILANGVDFGCKKNAVQLTFGNKTYYFRINKINRSSYIENIEFFHHNLKKKSLVYVYSPYKELAGDGMKFERTNDSSPFTSYTIKLVDDSTHLTKTLDISNNFTDELAKVYDRKNLIFM